MNTYRFKLSKAAIAGCIFGIILGLVGIGFTIYRILSPSLGFSSPQLIIQHVVIIIASLLALSVFPSILIRSVYKVGDKELVIYFKDERYTVIVVKPDWYNEFTKDICSRNNKIRYDVSTTEIDDKSDDF